jgi:hypothetical protein
MTPSQEKPMFLIAEADKYVSSGIFIYPEEFV